MKFKFGIQQALASLAVFVLILVALVSVDEHVRDRFSELVSGGGVESVGQKAAFLSDAVFDAVRYQSIENAPLVVFAVAGAVLFLFMVRT
jgi:hypothetical protein